MKTCRMLLVVSVMLVVSAVDGAAPGDGKRKEASPARPTPAESHVTTKDGVIHFFEDKPKEAVLTNYKIPGKPVWVCAARTNGKTRRVWIFNKQGEWKTRATKKTLVKFLYPFGGDSATWNKAVKREGDTVSVEMRWDEKLIGELKDVNDGAKEPAGARKKLGVTGPASKDLPVLFCIGDSISGGYRTFLQGELLDEVNVYNPSELCRDIPPARSGNNGNAQLSYGVLQTAYKDKRFKPDYLMVNFGLHMIRGHAKKLQEYGAWIEKFALLAKANGARLIWMNTTPYRQSFRPRQNETVKAFNTVAAKVAAKHGVPVIDLHACVLKQLKAAGDKAVFNADGVHFTDEMQKKQAHFMAKRIREIAATAGKKS